MTSTADATTFPVFHLEITDEHAIIPPPELRERLGVGPVDVLAVSIVGNQARVHKTTKADASRPVVGDRAPHLKGLLRDFFKDREDIQQFIEEERRGWEEREKKLGL